MQQATIEKRENPAVGAWISKKWVPEEIFSSVTRFNAGSDTLLLQAHTSDIMILKSKKSSKMKWQWFGSSVIGGNRGGSFWKASRNSRPHNGVVQGKSVPIQP